MRFDKSYMVLIGVINPKNILNLIIYAFERRMKIKILRFLSLETLSVAFPFIPFVPRKLW